MEEALDLSFDRLLTMMMIYCVSKFWRMFVTVLRDVETMTVKHFALPNKNK